MRSTVINTHVMKNNSLYILLKQFPDKITGIVNLNCIRTIANNNAYIITLPIKENCGLLVHDTNYKLANRHIRVDATYPKNNLYLSPVHYTEIYSSANKQQKLVIHAYYNYVGCYTFIEMKIIDLISTVEKKLTISEQNNNIILTNLEQATLLLKKLLECKNKLYQDELKNADQISRQLDQLSQKIAEADGLSKYIHTANHFIDCINNINSLNEVFLDRRATIIHKLITSLTEQKQLSENLLINQDDNSYNELSNQPVPTVANIVLPANAKINHQNILAELTHKANNYIQQCGALTKADINSLEAWQKLDQLLFNMQFVSLELLCIAKTSIKYKNKNHGTTNNGLTNQLETAITVIKKLISSSLGTAMHAGDIELIKSTFAISKHYLSVDLCGNFIIYLTSYPINTIEDTAHIEKLSAVCDLLYVETDKFKNMIIASCYVQHATDHIIYSLLGKLFNNNNLPIFKKFIEYGADAKTAFIYTRDKEPKFFPLLNILIYLLQTETPIPLHKIAFIEYILTLNLRLESAHDFSKYSVNKYKNLSYSTTGVIKRDDSMKLISKKIYDLHPLEVSLLSIDSEFNICNELVSLLAPISDLKNIIISIAQFMLYPYSYSRIIPCSHAHGIVVCENVDVLFTKLKQTNSSKLIIGISFDQDTPSSIPQALSIVWQAFKKKSEALYENDEYIMNIFNAINKDARDNKTEAHYVSNLKKLYARLFLLSLKSKLYLSEAKIVVSLLQQIIKTTTAAQLPVESIKIDLENFTSKFPGLVIAETTTQRPKPKLKM